MNTEQETYEPGVKGYIRRALRRIKAIFWKIPEDNRKKYIGAAVGVLILLLVVVRIVLSVKRHRKRSRRRRKKGRKRKKISKK